MSYSTTAHSESIRPRYKPVILRTASLVFLLLVTLGLIGLLEYGVRTLPHGQGRNSLVSRSVVLDQDHEHQILARQVESGSETPPTEPINTPVEPIDAPVEPIDAPAQSIIETPTTPIVTQSLPKDDYIPTETPASSADENDFIPTVVMEVPGISETIGSNVVGPSDYVPTGGGQYAPPSDYISPSDYVPTIASSAAGSDYIPAKQTATPEDQQAATPENQQAAKPAGKQDATPTGKQGATPAPTSKPMVVVSYSSHAVVATIQATLAPGSAPGSNYLQPSGGILTTSYEIFPVTMTVDGTDPDASGSPLEAGVAGKDGKKVLIVSYWNHLQVFYGTFLAVLLAVLYRILYSVLHSNLVLIDPFRQLLDSRGALAEHSFFSFYQNPSIVFGPFPALMKGRWAVSATATAYIVACMMPALASEVIWVDTNWGCKNPGPNPKIPCAPRLTTTGIVVRVLQGMLGFTGAVIIALIALLLSSKTGLCADPSSIATVSSLMRHPGLTEELNEMSVDPETTLFSMEQAIKGKRFGLGHWKTASGAQGYGIYPLGYNTDAAQTERTFFKNDRGEYSAVVNSNPDANAESSWNATSARSHTWMWMDPILLIVATGTFGVILAWRFTSGTTGFNGFFGSDTFGPRFILTGAATILANLWSTIEQSAMIMAPLGRLARDPALPNSTICFAPTNTPLLSTWRALRHGYFFVAMVTVITILGEALSIVISGVPYRAGQTYMTWLVSEYLSLAILGIMIISSIAVIFHRSREPKVPVLPETLGAKMLYLNGSGMLDDFEGVEGAEQRVRDETLARLGKWYEFAPMVRRDGRRRMWLVDEATASRNGVFGTVRC
ncbi:hypothetical protein CERZMDRAFT_92549 [Cercospora zeae-maydis SCOH1-5]|uniref:Uncharacterized protein n=1 Tax=Cercospora zeae-maydis SCOH1-5 TaxID=717836 RepID=A0A6A6FWP7_9PEZI|nr:hypothetical protein CERZMDRAFT_92549 [Cercospora zeae-maydis SCOH1-5]